MDITLTLLSGGIVGFCLGLIGGGGAILAVPLLIHVVGITDTHMAIGTSAMAVAVNALANLAQHARRGTVKWPCAITFALTGTIGAAIGSSIGLSIDGKLLLVIFSLAMFAVAITMLRQSLRDGDPATRIDQRIAVRLVGLGFLTGTLSGLLGIGGGFLIVPGLLLGSGMSILNAIGSSLLGVASFGMTTATNYALAGQIDWPVAGLFIAGGILGGMAGMWGAIRLSARRGVLTRLFALMLIIMAVQMFATNAGVLWGR